MAAYRFVTVARRPEKVYQKKDNFEITFATQCFHSCVDVAKSNITMDTSFLPSFIIIHEAVLEMDSYVS